MCICICICICIYIYIYIYTSITLETPQVRQLLSAVEEVHAKDNNNTATNTNVDTSNDNTISNAYS